ncbi:MAG TPA: hypothetical protein VJT09_17220 [Pyrinomonadaceae bacterium]|nr:hypothetical protein [Pyrinomonadaceae bacterium]
MNDAAFQRLIDRHILECRWSDISARWLNYLPSITPPGSAPNEGISEYIGFTTVASAISDYDKPVRKEVPRLREYVFREAVYLLHKAFHVTGCAENQAAQGYITWSLADAYQASLFGAKAILYFCGIALAEYNNKAVLIDVFPKEEDINKRRKQKLKLPEDPTIQLIKLNMKFEHRHVWAIFQRLLAVFDMSVWDNKYIRALKKLGHKDFAKQRNELNYKNEIWIHNDLHNLTIEPTFGVLLTDIEDALVYELESDFSLHLSLAILRMGILLLESIGEPTNILNDELQIIRDRITIDRHPMYALTYP